MKSKTPVSIADYALRDPLLFGDYRNAVNEAKNRFYEDLLDYRAIYFLFQEVQCSFFFISFSFIYFFLL